MQCIIKNPVKVLEYSVMSGAIIGATYGFIKSIQNTKWSSFTTRLGNCIFNVFIMGVGGAVIGLLSPVSMCVVVHQVLWELLREPSPPPANNNYSYWNHK